ncbi:ABC transporter permease subunit [Flavihumibacter sp. CACIAM 22H1]|uniref:ABC transporter permease subunit n=1 Tax=Flavihumibacter sp. CACIAM 22H1 TaxID=1812911 RepID=UPI000AF5F8C8|nr:ABC transporter permease subunit [Flavihumibacter sp. CACIAM 22H1]
MRNRIILAYTILLALVTISLFALEDNPAKAIMSLLNIGILIVPLVSSIFCTIYLYNSAEFIELLVAQPIRRSRLLWGVYLGMITALLIALLAGIGLPLLLLHPAATSLNLFFISCSLTIVFASLATLSAVLTRDKAKGIGLCLLLWFYFTFIFDGLVLLVLFQFADYPLDTAMIGMSMLNPIDMARIGMLLQLDISAMMGLTGALFQDFFGTGTGFFLIVLVMIVWMAFPILLAVRRFNHKDL